MFPINSVTHTTTSLIQFLVLLQATSRLLVENLTHESHVTLVFSALDIVNALCCFTAVIYLSVRCVVEQPWCWWLLDFIPFLSLFRDHSCRCFPQHQRNQKCVRRWYSGAREMLPCFHVARHDIGSCSRRCCEQCIRLTLEAGAELYSRFSSEGVDRVNEGCIAPKQQDMDRSDDLLEESGLELTGSIHDKNA